MFERVGESAFVQGEHAALKFWKQNRIFDKLRQKNQGKTKWSFIDGPITANNPMGVHHAWGRTYKDMFQRFRAMTGHELRYQNGFDCQGLWVEVEVEKQLGLGEKSKIEAFGIDHFSNECKKRVLKYAARQTEQSIRLGYWMDWDSPDELRKLSEKLGTDEQTTLKTPSGKQSKAKPMSWWLDWVIMSGAAVTSPSRRKTTKRSGRSSRNVTSAERSIVALTSCLGPVEPVQHTARWKWPTADA